MGCWDGVLVWGASGDQHLDAYSGAGGHAVWGAVLSDCRPGFRGVFGIIMMLF